MASVIDFLKRGLTADAKAYLDEIIIFTKAEAEKAMQKAIASKDIEKYIEKARQEEWVAGPIETLCDDYWFGALEDKVMNKIGDASPEIEDQLSKIEDLENVLYTMYTDDFTVLMRKKGFDDAKFHNDALAIDFSDGSEEDVNEDDIDDEDLTVKTEKE